MFKFAGYRLQVLSPNLQPVTQGGRGTLFKAPPRGARSPRAHLLSGTQPAKLGTGWVVTKKCGLPWVAVRTGLEKDGIILYWMVLPPCYVVV